MLQWIGDTAADVAEWVGSGVAALVEWLLGGLVDLFTIIIDAADGIWNVFESLWTLGTGFVGTLGRMLTVCFPFLPAPVAAVITAGLLAVLIAGIVKKVRGK